MRYNKVYEENDEDSEDYPQNNICYECGKQLKWEHTCPDCGVSNLDDNEAEEEDTDNWEEENHATYDPPVYNELEEKVNDLVDEISNLKEVTTKEILATIEEVEVLDKNIVELSKDFDEITH